MRYVLMLCLFLILPAWALALNDSTAVPDALDLCAALMSGGSVTECIVTASKRRIDLTSPLTMSDAKTACTIISKDVLAKRPELRGWTMRIFHPSRKTHALIACLFQED